jgi:hypothetical protein
VSGDLGPELADIDFWFTLGYSALLLAFIAWVVWGGNCISITRRRTGAKISQRLARAAKVSKPFFKLSER